jgi:hypothetical protein
MPYKAKNKIRYCNSELTQRILDSVPHHIPDYEDTASYSCTTKYVKRDRIFLDEDEYEEIEIDPSFCGELIALSDTFIEMLKSNEDNHLKKTLGIVENSLKDPQVDKNIVETCFFENILFFLVDNQEYKHIFWDNLGEESLKLCKSNEDFWEGKNS